MKTENNQAFWITGQCRAELRPEEELDTAMLPSGLVAVATCYSAFSRGTESLVYTGRVPPEEYERMRAPFQAGSFPYPVRYGYANVGRVIAGPDWLVDQTVFCLYPHQRYYQVPVEAVLPLPPEVPAARAVLAANMETALNGVWDGHPAVGDRVAVVGLGVVGLLVAWLLRQIPGVELQAIDPNAARAPVAAELGIPFTSEPSVADCDLVFHCSGHEQGLTTALGLAGQDARVVELSWYGAEPVSVPLGHGFHPKRLSLVSSQVGRLPASRAPRWDHRRRLAKALSLLAAPELDALISGESPFEILPETARSLLTTGADALCHRIVYS